MFTRPSRPSVVTVSASTGSSAIGSIVRTVALLDDARGASTQQRLRDVRAALARLVALPSQHSGRLDHAARRRHPTLAPATPSGASLTRDKQDPANPLRGAGRSAPLRDERAALLGPGSRSLGTRSRSAAPACANDRFRRKAITACWPSGFARQPLTGAGPLPRRPSSPTRRSGAVPACRVRSRSAPGVPRAFAAAAMPSGGSRRGVPPPADWSAPGSRI